MAIFAPAIERVGDVDVPVLCPNCGVEGFRNGLTDEEKRYLIDATFYHDLSVEYHHLLAINEILTIFPATRHPLLAAKLPRERIGECDETQVQILLEQRPGLVEFLRTSDFRFDRRFPWLQDAIVRCKAKIASLRVTCDRCEDQHLIFPERYFLSIGLW